MKIKLTINLFICTFLVACAHYTVPGKTLDEDAIVDSNNEKVLESFTVSQGIVDVRTTAFPFKKKQNFIRGSSYRQSRFIEFPINIAVKMKKFKHFPHLSIIFTKPSNTGIKTDYKHWPNPIYLYKLNSSDVVSQVGNEYTFELNPNDRELREALRYGNSDKGLNIVIINSKVAIKKDDKQSMKDLQNNIYHGLVLTLQGIHNTQHSRELELFYYGNGMHFILSSPY